jgi:hypothetical protein
LPGLEEQVRQLAQVAAGHLLDARAGATAFLELRLEAQALNLAFNDAFVLVTAVFACGLFLVPLLRRPS